MWDVKSQSYPVVMVNGYTNYFINSMFTNLASLKHYVRAEISNYVCSIEPWLKEPCAPENKRSTVML